MDGRIKITIRAIIRSLNMCPQMLLKYDILQFILVDKEAVSCQPGKSWRQGQFSLEYENVSLALQYNSTSIFIWSRNAENFTGLC